MKAFYILSCLPALGIALHLDGLLSGSSNQQPISLTRSSCPKNGPISCHRPPSNTNTCCYESPGGLLAQTQFWDTQPSTGPSDSWTIHGLWPDHCDGTFDENCDKKRAYTDIRDILSDNGASDTLQFMNDYWVDINGDNDHFWAHEWGKHGTCMSTLKPNCLPSGSRRGTDAVAYFQAVVRLFQTLPTYDWLASAGITPSDSETYTLDQLTSALQSASGHSPAFDCKNGVLNSIYWYFNLQGSVIDGTFKPIDAPKPGSCHGAITYPPK